MANFLQRFFQRPRRDFTAKAYDEMRDDARQQIRQLPEDQREPGDPNVERILNKVFEEQSRRVLLGRMLRVLGVGAGLTGATKLGLEWPHIQANYNEASTDGNLANDIYNIKQLADPQTTSGTATERTEAILSYYRNTALPNIRSLAAYEKQYGRDGTGHYDAVALGNIYEIASAPGYRTDEARINAVNTYIREVENWQRTMQEPGISPQSVSNQECQTLHSLSGDPHAVPCPTPPAFPTPDIPHSVTPMPSATPFPATYAPRKTGRHM